VQMFNTMLYPFIGYTIRGAIWSQGEGNVSRSYEYQALCTKMINAWREKWHIGDFPFYIAQLVPAGAADNLNQVIMREAQLNTSLLTKNAGLAVLMDLFPSASVHYPQKKVVGDRLANLALVNNYQATGVAMGPVLKKFSINKNVINLTFNYAGTGLTAKDSLSNFEIAGADLVYYPAQATFADANFSINVTSVNVSNPLHVRYAFKNRVGASLYNKEGHPASSFRTETIATNFMLKETEKTRR
jgi:sialate O-acetylesterase